VAINEVIAELRRQFADQQDLPTDRHVHEALFGMITNMRAP
jgi:hypothetical protein